MTGTTTGTRLTAATYDPIPDLARLLCAAQRQDHPLPGLEFIVAQLMKRLDVPQLAHSDEAEEAIRIALPDPTSPAGILALDARLRFLLGGKISVLTAEAKAALRQLHGTIGAALDEDTPGA